MDEEIGQRTHGQVRMPEHSLGGCHSFLTQAAFVHQQHIPLHRYRNPGLKPIQEILQRRSTRHRRRGDAVGYAVVPHGAAAKAHHLLLLVRFLTVEGQKAAFEAGGR